MMTSSLDIPLEPSLMPEQAREIVAQGEDAAVFALLETAKLLAQQQDGHPAIRTGFLLNLPHSMSEVCNCR